MPVKLIAKVEKVRTCPKCEGFELIEIETGLLCKNCGRVYPK